MHKAALEYRSAETTLSQIEQDIQAAETALAQKSETFQNTTKKMGRLLVALRTLKTGLTSHVLATNTSTKDILHQSTMMRAYVRSLYAQINQLHQEIADLETTKQALRNKKDTMHKSVHTHKTAYEKLETLVTIQKKEAQQKKAEIEKEKQLLAKAANLKDLVQNLEKNSTIPQSHINATGLLLPVQGPLVVPYGKIDEKSPDGKGIVLRARPKAFVLAPTTGTVLFAGPFRSYNKILIIGFNKLYTLLLTGMDNLSVKTGQTVRVGDPVGQMSPDSKTYLYLEMRKNGSAVKPDIVGVS